MHRQGPVRQKGGPGEAQATGRNPTDRGKPGTKRHLLTEATGIPTALVVTGANRHDMTQLAALLDGTVVEPAPTAPPHLKAMVPIAPVFTRVMKLPPNLREFSVQLVQCDYGARRERRKPLLTDDAVHFDVTQKSYHRLASSRAVDRPPRAERLQHRRRF